MAEEIKPVEGYRLVEFEGVKVKQVGPKELSVTRSRITVNPDQVGMVTPATIPGEIAGPDGMPVGIPATALHMAGGQILVTCNVQEAEYKLMTESITPIRPVSAEKESAIIS